MKKKYKNKKGITLVALVITVIVLLILATFSIQSLTNTGLFGKAKEAKEKYQISNEQEAINLILISKHMEKNFEYVGKKLYSKNFLNSDKWDYIVTTNSKKNYGDGWYYIKKATELDGYGKTQHEWLVNYDTNEIVELKDKDFAELSINNIILADGLIFNIDSNDISVSDKTTWGDGVQLYGFENDKIEDSKGALYFDGIDDYISFKTGGNFENGFTFSFYGIPYGSYILAKQKERIAEYSCRFGWSEDYDDYFSFNTSKNMANSTWSSEKDINNKNNGNLEVKCGCQIGEDSYIDLTFNPTENRFILYKNGTKMDETYVDKNYWHGKDGGRQIFEDTSIDCYVGRWFGGDGGTWNFSKAYIYNMKLYNRNLSDEEIETNYIKTTAYHNN